MVTLIVVTAIGVVVYIASDLFREESLTRVQETNKDVAESLADQVFAILKDSTDKMTLMTQTVSQAKGQTLAAESQQLIQNILRSNDELLSFGVYRPAGNGGYNEIYFATKEEVLAEFDLSLADLKAKPAASITAAVAKHPDNITLLNTSPILNKPILTMAFLTKENPQTKERWLIRCELRQEPLIKLFAKKSFLTAYLVDADGNLLVHSDPKMILRNYNVSVYPIVQKMHEGKLNNHQMEFEDDQGEAYIGAFKTLGIGGTGVVAQVKKEHALAAVLRVQYRALLVTCIVVGLAFIFNFIFSQSMTSPLSYLYWATEKIAEGDFNVKLEPQSNDEIGALTTAFKKMTVGLQERDKLKSTFSKFHSKEIAQKILSGEIKLGGEKKMATVFFSDIRGFTPLSESMTPDEVVRMLNEYMTEMVNIIYKHSGVVDKYVGDAIMALWGVPNSGPQDAINAVRAALDMRKAMRTLNQKRKSRGQPEINIGMGIHSGEVLAGNIGSDQRLEYTVIGDTVNQSSRIESANKDFGSDLLISDSTYALVKSKGIIAGPPISIKVKGKAQNIFVHQVIGVKSADGVLDTALDSTEQENIRNMTEVPEVEIEADDDEVKVIAKKPKLKQKTQITKKSKRRPEPVEEDEEVETDADADEEEANVPADEIYIPPMRPKVAARIRAGSQQQAYQPPQQQTHATFGAPSQVTAAPMPVPTQMTTTAHMPPAATMPAAPVPDLEFDLSAAQPRPTPMATAQPVSQAAPSEGFANVLDGTNVMSQIQPDYSTQVKETVPTSITSQPHENMMAIMPASEEPQPPIPTHLPTDDQWYMVKDPLSKEHDGPYTIAQIKVIAAQPGFPYNEAFVFRHGDAQMTPLSQVPAFSRRYLNDSKSINAPLPAEDLQAQAAADEWYIYGTDTKTYGPYSLDQLREALSANHITRTTYCWKTGMQKWTYLYQIPGFNRRETTATHTQSPIPLGKIKKPA
jgi:adenylate cyclase